MSAQVRVPARAWWRFAATATAAFVLDQVSKAWAIGRLTHAHGLGPDASSPSWRAFWADFWTAQHPPARPPLPVWANFWHFRYVENPGAAFGFLSGQAAAWRTPFFLVISLTAMGFLLNYFRSTRAKQRSLRVGLALVFGGALGNFVDRSRLGYVIDFIDWHWFEAATWPTFNVADAAISVGVGLLLLDMLTHRE